ncbi:MAG: anti-sigma factor [Vicinamibacterales bacterium]
MMGHEAFDVDVAAYALDALPSQERRAFETHLATCADCQRELVSLQRVAAGIGASTDPMNPPAGLRARVLSRATAQPQDLPVPNTAVPVAGRPVPRVPGRYGVWLALAASIACVGLLGTYAWALRAQLTTTRELLADLSVRTEALRAQLASARQDSATLTNAVNVIRSGRVIKVDLRGQGTAPDAAARALVGQGGGLVFNADHLPPLARDRSYQLWVFAQGSSEPIGAGTFDVDASGSSTMAIGLPAGVTVVAALAVTDEPKGGSPRPTTSPLLLGKPVAN